MGLSILLWLPKFSWYINRNMPRLGRKMTTFRITSTENYHFRNHHDGILSFSERPRRKITIFGTTSTENYHIRNHLDRKLPYSEPPRRKITIFATTLTENNHFRNHLDGKLPFKNHLERKFGTMSRSMFHEDLSHLLKWDQNRNAHIP